MDSRREEEEELHDFEGETVADARSTLKPTYIRQIQASGVGDLR